MAQSKNVVQEMVVSLSAQIDNPGIQKILTLLDANRLRVMTLSAAIAAATTGVYKFISSITKEEIELRQLAKTKNKELEQLRAEESALKTMGKTLDEIKKDKALKSMYDDLVKFNKELSLPNMDNAMEKVDKLRSAFYKFRSAISYSLKWIGSQVLVNLEAPIDRITGKLTNAANWIKNNITQLTSKIASFITGFAKGLIGIAETVEKIVGWVGNLPEGIRAIGAAIGVLAALVSSGPLGQLLAAVTAIGDVIHDYENFQWNQANKKNPQVYSANNKKGYTSDINDPNIIMEDGKPVAYQVPIAFGSIWDVLWDDSTDTKEKSRNIAEKIVTKLTGLFTDISDILSENRTLEGILSQPTSIVGQVLSGVKGFFDENPDKIGELIRSFFDSIGEVVATAGGWGASAVGAIAKLFSYAFSDEGNIWKNDNLVKALNGKNGIINGLFGALELSAIGASPLVSIIGGIFGGFTTERDNALEKLYKDYNRIGDAEFKSRNLKKSTLEAWFNQMVSEGKIDSGALNSEIGVGLQDDFNTALDGILNMLMGGIKIAGDTAGNLLKSIIYAIIGTSENDAANTMKAALGAIGEDNPIWDGLATGLATWIGSGNFLVGLLSGIGTMLASTDGEEQLKKAASEFIEMFMTIWDGAWIDEADHSKGRNNRGLHRFIKEIWEGSEGQAGLKSLFDGLAQQITTWLEPVGDAIEKWFFKLLKRMYKNGNGVVKFAMKELGYEVGRGDVVTNDKGDIVGFEDPNGNRAMFREGKHYSNDAMRFLAEFGTRFEINDAGEYTVNSTDGTNNQTGIFGAATIDTLLNKVLKTGEFKLPNGLDYNGFMEQYMKNNPGFTPIVGVEPLVDTESIEMQLYGKKFYIHASVIVDGEEGDVTEAPHEAWGGRIGSAGHYLVGEDGAEYIIPITKTQRAIELITQMLGEMGSSVTERIFSGMGLGQTGTIGADMSSLSSAMNGMVMNNTYNISAPVSINVNASGASAEDIGTQAYNLAERHLVKSLKGVYA